MFKIGQVVGEGLSDAVSAEIATAIVNYMNDYKVKFENDGTRGDLDNHSKFPMEVISPMAAIYELAPFA